MAEREQAKQPTERAPQEPGTELDSGFQAEDGARTRHTGGANF